MRARSSEQPALDQFCIAGHDDIDHEIDDDPRNDQGGEQVIVRNAQSPERRRDNQRCAKHQRVDDRPCHQVLLPAYRDLGFGSAWSKPEIQAAADEKVVAGNQQRLDLFDQTAA